MICPTSVTFTIPLKGMSHTIAVPGAWHQLSKEKDY